LNDANLNSRWLLHSAGVHAPGENAATVECKAWCGRRVERGLASSRRNRSRFNGDRKRCRTQKRKPAACAAGLFVNDVDGWAVSSSSAGWSASDGR
jgi:hypothetical protein